MKYSYKLRINSQRVRPDGTAALFHQVIIDSRKTTVALQLYWPADRFDSAQNAILPRQRRDVLHEDLLHVWRNEAGLAATLRWGYVRYSDATGRAGYGPLVHRSIIASLAALRDQYVQLGGNANVLRYVVLMGRGNQDRRVRPTTRDQAGLNALLARDPDYRALRSPGLAGLAGGTASSGGGSGELLTSIIKLALPIILKLLGGLKAKPNDPNDPVPAEYLQSEEEEEPDDYEEEE